MAKFCSCEAGSDGDCDIHGAVPAPPSSATDEEIREAQFMAGNCIYIYGYASTCPVHGNPSKCAEAGVEVERQAELWITKATGRITTLQKMGTERGLELREHIISGIIREEWQAARASRKESKPCSE